MSTNAANVELMCSLASIQLATHPTTRIVCIDGPAGSGKTTLAQQLAESLNAQTVHMDDLYAGWTGLVQGSEILVEKVLTPLAQGTAGSYHRYDWVANHYAEAHVVPPAQWLVVEGCASATIQVDQFSPFIIWVEAGDTTRLERGLARDGEDLKPQWLAFMRDEAAIYSANNTCARAHVRLDGFGNIVGGSALANQ